MNELKHVGRIAKTGKKVLVAYRTLPGDAYNCLVIPTEQLDDSKHFAIINLVESISGQQAYEFAEALYRTQFPDGSNMLAWLSANEKLVKVATDLVEMIPAPGYSILLSELNQHIAESKGVAVDDLAIKDTETAQPPFEKDEIPPTQDTKPVDTINNVTIDTYFTALESEIEKLETNEEKAARYRSEVDKLQERCLNITLKADSLSSPKTESTQPTETVNKSTPEKKSTKKAK